MDWIIVKHAGDNSKFFYFEDDPKMGCHESYSAYFTPTGKTIAKQKYDDYEEAQQDCALLNTVNPVGDYAVCPVIEGEKNGH